MSEVTKALVRFEDASERLGQATARCRKYAKGRSISKEMLIDAIYEVRRTFEDWEAARKNLYATWGSR